MSWESLLSIKQGENKLGPVGESQVAKDNAKREKKIISSTLEELPKGIKNRYRGFTKSYGTSEKLSLKHFSASQNGS